MQATIERSNIRTLKRIPTVNVYRENQFDNAGNEEPVAVGGTDTSIRESAPLFMFTTTEGKKSCRKGI